MDVKAHYHNRMSSHAGRRLLLVWVGICAAVLPLLVLEGILRLLGYGYPPDFFVPISESGAYTTNQKFGRRFFPALLARTPVPARFSRRRESRAYRIFILGESAAMGFPEPGLSFGRYLESMLRQMYPERRFEVINTAMTAINSHALLPIARDCARFQPDAFVVYAGNNEVVGPYGAGTVFDRRALSLGVIRTLVAVNATRTRQLLASYTASAGQPAEWRGMEMFLGQTVIANDPRLQKVYANFRRNLTDICTVAREGGARVVLSTVAVNLKDSPPFASAHRSLSPQARSAWEQHEREGSARAARGEYGAAVEQFAAAAAIDDGFADLQFRRAQCLTALGKIEEARREFIAARDLDTLRFRADSRINATVREVARETGVRLADAEAIFAQGGIPGDNLFYEHVHLKPAGNDLLSRAVLPEVIASLPELHPTAVPPAEAVARDLAHTAWDDYRASAQITALMRRPPFHGHPAGVRPPPREALDEAKALYQDRLAARPDDLSIRERLADLLAYRGELAAAETEWNKLLDSLPDVEPWRTALATVLLQQDKLDLALHEYERVLRGDGKSAIAEFGAGSVLEKQRRWFEAGRHYAAALRLNPNYAEVENNLGLMRIESAGDVAGAVEHYRAALRMNEESAETHNNLALALAALGDHDGAIEHYRRALALNPSMSGTRMNLAALLARRGAFAEAANAYEEALRANPDDFDAHYSLAGLLAKQGQDSAATIHLEAAVRLRPASSEAHYDLGTVLSRQGQLEKAASEFTAALQLRPGYAEAWNNLGSALARRGNMDRAIVCFRKALELRPDLPGARSNLAAALSTPR
jgi:tetratricopeptide (TPR) repeat protein